MTATWRPLTRPTPVITPSAGYPSLIALARRPSSTKLPSSSNKRSRSRTGSLVPSRSLDPPALAVAMAAASSALGSSALTRAASESVSASRRGPFGEDLQLDLVGAAADSKHAGVAVVPGDGRLVHEALPTEQLHGLVGHGVGHPRGDDLGHGHRLLGA